MIVVGNEICSFYLVYVASVTSKKFAMSDFRLSHFVNIHRRFHIALNRLMVVFIAKTYIY